MKCSRNLSRPCFAGLILISGLLFLGCGPGLIQADFLISWSPDGSRAAIAPWPFENPDATEAGLWVLDPARGEIEKIVSLGGDNFCIHPQWSPHADELVFGIIQVEGNDPKMEGGLIPLSVWITDSRGCGLRKIAEASCGEASILAPNLITWSGYPGTIVYPEVWDGKMTAVQLDLTSLRTSSFLPHPATTYLIRFSPDRDKVAAILYQDESKTAEIYLGDVPLGLWWKLDVLPCDEEALELPDPTIYWSPDGSKFAVPSLKPQARGRYFIHLYDSLSRLSTRIEADPTETGFFWNADGSALVYSVAPGTGANNPPGLYRADIRSGRVHPVMLLPDYHVLSWNLRDDRIYLIHQSEGGNSGASPILSSFSPAGLDPRWLAAPPLSGEWGWDVSPGGDTLLFITNHAEVRSFHLKSGSMSPALTLN